MAIQEGNQERVSMNLFKYLSIGKKLLILLLLISLLPPFIITYGFYSLGKAKLTEQTIHVLEVQSKNVAASIDHFIDSSGNWRSGLGFAYPHLHEDISVSAPSYIQAINFLPTINSPHELKIWVMTSLIEGSIAIATFAIVKRY